MCGQCRPPPQLNVYNNSLQVMPLVIKLKHLAYCSEADRADLIIVGLNRCASGLLKRGT